MADGRAGYSEMSPWLRHALLGVHESEEVCGDAASAPLIARLPMLGKRMRQLLSRSLYARASRAGGAMRGRGDPVSDNQPVGFVGASNAEELCSAVFGRIHALQTQGVGKQVNA